MPEAVDQQLVGEARNGSADAFETLVKRYEPRVTGLCRRILGSRADAEDAAISTFTKAWRALARYDPTRPFDTWLFTIAAREAVTLARSRRLWTSLEEVVEGSAGLALASSATYGRPSDPEAVALGGEETAAVLAALTRLSLPARTAVVLRYQLERSYAEIGALLGVPAGTVGTLLHRAKKQLRQFLEEGM